MDIFRGRGDIIQPTTEVFQATDGFPTKGMEAGGDTTTGGMVR